jgi:hypothetical protein
VQQIRSQHVCLDGPIHAVLLFSTTVAFTKDSAEILGAHDVRAPPNARNGEIVTVRPHRLIFYLLRLQAGLYTKSLAQARCQPTLQNRDIEDDCNLLACGINYAAFYQVCICSAVR